MRVRSKLLVVLLAIALAPLIASAVLHRVSMRRLGDRLASDTRETLTEDARGLLRDLVDDYGRILMRDKKALELAVSYQAAEVERRLAAAPPPSPRLFLSHDYDRGVNLPEGMAPSDQHYRTGPDGTPQPIPVTYQDQVYFVVEGVDRQAIADDLARLCTMPEAYRFVYRFNPDLMYWQYTSLESGFHTSFPGHGGYPPEYDPRRRDWYKSAKAAGSVTWLVMPEVSTRTVTQAVAVPVFRPDGSFAGVTAIDVPFNSFFKELKLPEKWAGQAEAMLVVAKQDGAGGVRLEVLVHRSYERHGADWQVPLKLEHLESEDRAEFRTLLESVARGESGVHRMRYQGEDALWSHGFAGAGEPFPVVIVPYGLIIARATEARDYVLARTVEGLKVTGLLLLVVIAVMTVLAFLGSRAVTRPVRELAEGAQRLASGDYEAQVVIRTGDELQELGELFNQIGPQLREREKLRQSLALAGEIQEHLLPKEPPQIEGFDIAGATVYCDETGGDYYDFIELMDLGSGRLGIVVGDVTGHGIGAALLMASARGALRSLAVQHGSDLAELFTSLNRHLTRDVGAEWFMTLFYGFLDASVRSLSWTSAGHDPALWLRRRSGEIEELGSGGFPLGIVEDATYDQNGPVTLGPGDVVVIGTDGIWEAANADEEMFGKQRLRDLLVESAGMPSREIYGVVVRAVEEFRGAAPQKDDVTLVVIKAL